MVVNRLLGAAAVLCVSFPLVASCGDDSEGGTVANTGGGSATGGKDGSVGGTGGAVGGTGGDASIDPDSPSCQTGAACGDGGICAGGVCCDKANACGNDCCSGAELCSFQKCVTPGKTCTESSDCATGEYCELALGSTTSDAGSPSDAGSCTGGIVFAEGKCLPKPPECTGTPGPDCLPKCELPPSTAAFDPEVTYTWGGDTAPPYSSDVMMTPIVVQLDDDNCDGKITERDIPEIVFLTFANGGYTGIGTLHAISIVDKKVVEKFSVPGILSAASELAGGNIDGKPGNEVVGCSAGTVSAFDGTGQKLWTSPSIGCRAPALADLDGDGNVEVVVEGGILNGKDGTLKQAFTNQLSIPSVSDLDGDGKLDITNGRMAYRADGTLLADSSNNSSWSAVGDLNKDGKPEIVGIDPSSGQRRMHVWRVNPAAPGGAEVVRTPFDIHETAPSNPCGHLSGGGPPTIADFNGDGTPDVALAGSIAYVIFDGKKLMDPTVASTATLLWQSVTQDCSSAATGSSVFDFNGDGKAEAVYSDEIYVRVYDGATGNELWKTCNTTGTLIEYPVIADVDNDGQADIVVASNAYAFTCDGTKQSGIRVIQSKSKAWVRTRRVWNQHTYHVTNVQEDGSIPAKEIANWTVAGLNNFRQNKQPGSELAAPDATVVVKPRCTGPFGVLVEVRNLGSAPLPPGIQVDVYAGNPPPAGTPLATAKTTVPLYAAQAEVLSVDLPTAPADVKSGATPVFATITPPAGVIECKTDNNSSKAVSAVCAAPR